MGGQQSKLDHNDQLAARLAAVSLDRPATPPFLDDEDFTEISVSRPRSAIAEKILAKRVAQRSSQPTPMTISPRSVAEWTEHALSSPKNQLALSAFSSNSLASIISQRAAQIADTQLFNVKIPFEGAPVPNQRASGRCWLFASTNVFRVALMKRHGLTEFQLSQAYLFFWDKLEKANYFLEQILDTSDDEPVTGRTVQTLLASPVGDGGQWDMVVNLVAKYGLVPHDLYPDSQNAMNSREMDTLLTTKLREDALRLRSLKSKTRSDRGAGLTALKEAMMKEIHLILMLCLGPPPQADKDFTFQFYDKDNALKTLKTTPLDFAKELSSSASLRVNSNTDPRRMFSLVNDPRNPYNKLLTVNRLGNVVGGEAVRYVNVDLPTIKKAVISMLKKGIPVFFGCDVGKYLDNPHGIMDTALFDYELGFNVKLGMSKAERMVTGESQMTHAMTLTGVHLDQEGKPVRWRIMNSWGADAGKDGFYVMTDRWFDQFVYQAVVDPSFVEKEVKDALKGEPITLDLWDPMGSLA